MGCESVTTGRVLWQQTLNEAKQVGPRDDAHEGAGVCHDRHGSDLALTQDPHHVAHRRVGLRRVRLLGHHFLDRRVFEDRVVFFLRECPEHRRRSSAHVSVGQEADDGSVLDDGQVTEPGLSQEQYGVEQTAVVRQGGDRRGHDLVEESWLAHEQYRYLAAFPAYAQVSFLIFRGLCKKTLVNKQYLIPELFKGIENMAIVIVRSLFA